MGAPSTTNVFRRRQQETLPKINRSSTISQDLTSSLRGGVRGRSTQVRGPSSPVPRAQPYTGRWFPPLAGKLDGCGCQFSPGQARKQESQVSEAKGTGSAGEGNAEKTTGLGVWSRLPSRTGDGGARGAGLAQQERARPRSVQWEPWSTCRGERPWVLSSSPPPTGASYWLNPAVCLGSQARRVVPQSLAQP